MKKRYRITRQRDFQSTMDAPRLHAGRALVGFATRRSAAGSRVGVAVSRKLRGSVVRNRARRRVREVVRTVLLAPDSVMAGAGIGYDVIVIARPAALDMPFGLLQAEAGVLLTRLVRA